MGALNYSQGALWAHSSLANVSSAPFGNRTRSGPKPLALPSLIPHGGWKSGIAAEPRHLVSRVSPPSPNSASLEVGTSKFDCHSKVLNKMLMLRSATFNFVILNKRRDMLVEKLSMGSSGLIRSHHLGCNFKAGCFHQSLPDGRTLRKLQNRDSGSNQCVSSCAAFSQNNVCKSASGSRSKKLTGTIRSSLANGFKTDMNSSSSSEAEILQASKGVFPGGLRRAEVRLPGLVLKIRVEEMQGKEEEAVVLEEISGAVAGGVTMIILESSGDGGMGGAKLYEAACTLKAMLRGRAELLIAERVDIAAAAGADGVLLSDEGLPAVVARRMMQNAAMETPVLPLVARSVSSAQSALTATAGEGADLLILKVNEEKGSTGGGLVKSLCQLVSIPIFLDASESRRSGLDFLQEGANGLVLGANIVKDAANGDASGYVSGLVEAISATVQRRKELENSALSEDGVQVGNIKVVDDGGAFLAQPVGVIPPNVYVDEDPMEKLVKEIVEEQRVLLTSMVDFMKEASPEMEEVTLLVDAVKQLDELFLSVIVGEFNSGKSSVINALLGKRFLKEGVLPTTNEITLLRHANDGGDTGERSERHPDGHFLRFLPADLLKQMNLVDTPGTNVILQRQQRLTEEFVPRADLVLFVLSADRPLTESEVTFLRYIRQWGKKIIFILNKSDVLTTYSEVEDVSNFIKDNAQRLLSVEEALVYPVSARQALQAKISASLEDGSIDVGRLSQDPLWTTSGFQQLEDFIFGFMGASTERGAERLRLKLETPLGIGAALLAACDRQLVAEALKAESDLKALADVQKQLERYEQAMLNDAILQRQRPLAEVEAAKGRANKFVNSILRLSNIEAAWKYLIGSGRSGSMPVSSGFDTKVIGSAVTDVQKALEEHKVWIELNSVRQLSSYRSLVRSRWPQVNDDIREGSNEESAVMQSQNGKRELDGDESTSLAVLKGFDTNAALQLLEQEIKEVVISTFSGFGVAGVSASVLTTILPNTIEDLIALGVCSAGGLVGVWNLPSRREDVKKKVNQVADSLARQIEDAMKSDLELSIETVRAEVESLTRPYRRVAEEELARVAGFQEQLEIVELELRRLRQRVQNVGT